MTVYSYQQRGIAKDKANMEDRIFFAGNILSDGYHCTETAREGLYAIMDGVGGLRGSAYASEMIARALSDIHGLCNLEQLKVVLQKAHMELVDYTSTGTTLTGIYITADRVTLMHIGNCRLYGLYDGYLRRMTIDQTAYEELRKEGYEDKDIPQESKCVLNACLGVKREFFGEMVMDDISKAFTQCSRILLTSDGVHDFVKDEELELFLKGDLSMERFRLVYQKALTCGSEDDCSMMVVEL